MFINVYKIFQITASMTASMITSMHSMYLIKCPSYYYNYIYEHIYAYIHCTHVFKISLQPIPGNQLNQSIICTYMVQ